MSLPETFATTGRILAGGPESSRPYPPPDSLATGSGVVLGTAPAPVRLTFDPPAAPDGLDAAFVAGLIVGRGDASVPPPEHYSRAEVMEWWSGVEHGQADRDHRRVEGGGSC